MQQPYPEPLWWELLLIAVAFFMSAILVVATGLKDWFVKHPWSEIVTIAVCSSCCVLSGIAGFALFVVGRTSPDVFGLILIGLVPALQAASNVRISALLARARMLRSPALGSRLPAFRYLRHGNPPPADVWRAVTMAPRVHIDIYIRVPASSRLNPKWPDVRMWHGYVADIGGTVIKIKDFNDMGDPVKWWQLASRAVEIVRSPIKAHITGHDNAIRALEAVAELAMIGDSVLEHHADRIRMHAEKSERLSEALSTTPLSVCTSFLDAVGLLHEWGPINEKLRTDFVTNYHALTRSKRYGMLFFMLLVESEIFGCPEIFGCVGEKTVKGNRVSRVSANDVIEAFTKKINREDRESITQKWLAQYGLTKDRLDKYSCNRGSDVYKSGPNDPTSLTYALIPLPPNAVSHDPKDFTMAFEHIRSAIQDGSILPVPSAPLTVTVARGSRVNESPSIIPGGNCRVVMPFVLAEQPAQSEDTGGEDKEGVRSNLAQQTVKLDSSESSFIGGDASTDRTTKGSSNGMKNEEGACARMTSARTAWNAETEDEPVRSDNCVVTIVDEDDRQVAPAKSSGAHGRENKSSSKPP